MRIGIFGSTNDQQCKAIAHHLQKKGAEVVLVESSTIKDGGDWAFDGDFHYDGSRLDDVGAWYLRYIMLPYPFPFQHNDELFLFRDWYVKMMQKREHYAFQLSMMLIQGLRGVPVLNPPQCGAVMQFKPFQIAAAQGAGLTVPKTLITNSMDRVLRFRDRVEDVVYKPSMGGGLCKPFTEDDLDRLDVLVRSPVTFQERIEGNSVRLTMVGGEIVSAVRVVADTLDYRSSPEYQAGEVQYERVEVPDAIREQTLRLMINCGLFFTGADFVVRDSGEWVFLEANRSPVYLEIERKTGAPISEALATLLLYGATNPHWYEERVREAAHAKTFARYANPYAPEQELG